MRRGDPKLMTGQWGQRPSRGLLVRDEQEAGRKGEELLHPHVPEQDYSLL